MCRAVIDVIEKIEHDEHQAQLNPEAVGMRQKIDQAPMMRRIPLRHRDAHRDGAKLDRRDHGEEGDIERAMAQLVGRRLRKEDFFRDPAREENRDEQNALNGTRMAERKARGILQTHGPAFHV